jgi:hypothetical protein
MENETLNQLKLGLELNQVENILGSASDIGTNELWEADGAYHQRFIYKNLGIELDLIGDEKNDKVINTITINQPYDFKTSNNISIGSSYNEVEKFYKKYYNKDFSDKDTFVAVSIYGGVIFNF